jgi:hypothetical protein
MAEQAMKKQNADDGSVDNVQTTKSDVIKNTILKMALPRWSASLRGFMNIHLSDNDPDDRAGASKFSIWKRPIPRFGPSDGSCIAYAATQSSECRHYSVDPFFLRGIIMRQPVCSVIAQLW